MNIQNKYYLMDRVNQETSCLREIAKACRMIGMKELDARLYSIAYEIDRAVAELDEMIRADIDERLDDAKKNAGAILNALASGARIGTAVESLPHTLGGDR